MSLTIGSLVKVATTGTDCPFPLGITLTVESQNTHHTDFYRCSDSTGLTYWVQANCVVTIKQEQKVKKTESKAKTCPLCGDAQVVVAHDVIECEKCGAILSLISGAIIPNTIRTVYA